MKKRVAAIDIGTTKICTIMGVIDNSFNLRVLGVGIAASHGIEKALIADAGKARASIKQSIRRAEQMAGYRLDSACIGVTGRHIHSLNSKGAIAITRSKNQVKQEDLDRALEVSLNIDLPIEQQILHVIPRAYRLDGQQVENPIGMNGYELEVDVHVITASASSIDNLTKVIRSLGVKIDDLMLESLASAEAVLAEEEKLAGVLIADIGGGTTDIAVIKDESIFHTSVLPAAGQQITNDLSAGLGLSYELAEEMKRKYGTLIINEEGGNPDRKVGENGHSISFDAFYDIILARVEEIIRLIVIDLPGEDRRLIPAGIVITGGCANLNGIDKLAEKLTRLPVRVGMPAKVSGVSIELLNDPAFATSVGLILMAAGRPEKTSKWFKKPKGFRGFLSNLAQLFR
jgi:cell division protein FtsA